VTCGFRCRASLPTDQTRERILHVIGTRLGPYEVIAKLGEGGPPLLAGCRARATARSRR